MPIILHCSSLDRLRIGLGSVVAITAATGTLRQDQCNALTSQQRYLPFGGVRELPNYATTTQTTDLSYTGQREMGMGLMDYKFRFYSPLLGRFISPDTITPDMTQGLNRYSYVTNNPIRYNDPSGHSVDCALGEQYCEAGKLTTEDGGDDDDGGETPTVPNGIPTAPPVTSTETPSAPNMIIPSYESDTTPSNIVCITPTPGTINCFLPRYPGVGLGIGFKDWEDIDKIDLVVDVAGIVGDMVKRAGYPGVVFWLGTEVAELVTLSRPYDRMDAGDPAAAIDIAVDTGITVAQFVRMSPKGGWIGNLAGIGLNVLQIETVP